MSTLTEEERTRLDNAPKWVNNLVDKLEADLEGLRKERAAMFDADPDQVEVSLVYFNGVSGNNYGGDHQALKSHQAVRFNFPHLKNNPHIDVKLDPLRGGISVASSEGLLYVLPDSANVIHVGVK